MTSAEVSEALGLPLLTHRQWQIFRCSATKGEGLNEGLDWYLSLTNYPLIIGW
jgi:ADP-ribosylation factor-like protein 1